MNIAIIIAVCVIVVLIIIALIWWFWPAKHIIAVESSPPVVVEPPPPAANITLIRPLNGMGTATKYNNTSGFAPNAPIAIENAVGASGWLEIAVFKPLAGVGVHSLHFYAPTSDNTKAKPLGVGIGIAGGLPNRLGATMIVPSVASTAPISYTKIAFIGNMHIWQPIAPPGYHCRGFWLSTSPPSTSNPPILCIRNDIAVANVNGSSDASRVARIVSTQPTYNRRLIWDNNGLKLYDSDTGMLDIAIDTNAPKKDIGILKLYSTPSTQITPALPAPQTQKIPMSLFKQSRVTGSSVGLFYSAKPAGGVSAPSQNRPINKPPESYQYLFAMNAEPIPGYMQLGHIPAINDGNQTANTQPLFAPANIAVRPIDYHQVILGYNTASDYSLWRPIAPPGGTCVGDIASIQKPSLDATWCVNGQLETPLSSTGGKINFSNSVIFNDLNTTTKRAIGINNYGYMNAL